MKIPKRIAVLTAGGDCPGLNAVIRAVTKKAIHDYGMKVIGIEDGYDGLIHGHSRNLESHDVSGILTVGGTILGTSNTGNPYKYAVEEGGKVVVKDLSRQAIANLKRLKVGAVVCIGGDGTLGIAYRLYRDGIPTVGVPKTIDNDIIGTEITFGFDSAVSIVTEGIDRVHTTAQSHHRIMIVEVMGRRAGWIALFGGIAGGGDIILIPEIPYDVAKVARVVKERHKRGKRFSIVVISEGAKPRGGDVVVRRLVKDGSEPVRLGGVGFVLGEQLEKATGLETRTVVMGHLQRGGTPTPFDRVLATQLGSRAIDMTVRGEFGHMMGMQRGRLVNVPLETVAKGQRTVPRECPLIATARSLGASFGD